MLPSAASSLSSSGGSLSSHLVPSLSLSSSAPSTARPSDYSDTEMELNEEEFHRVQELAKVTYKKPLPPTPVDVPSVSQPESLPPTPTNPLPKMVRSPSTMSNLNRLLGPLVNPAAIFRIDGKPTSEKMATSMRPEYSSFKDPVIAPATSAAAIKQEEEERKLQARAFDGIKAIIQAAKPVEELYAELHSLYIQNRLIPLLPHIMPLIPNRKVVDDLLILSCQKTEKDAPFRQETPGITIFCYELMPEIEKVLGKRSIGQIAYSIICNSMKLGKYITTPRGELLPSPKQREIERLYTLFMTSLAEKLSGSFGAKAFQITGKMRCLLSILRTQSYGFYSSEKKRRIVISSENLLLNLFILRFVNPELYQGYILLKDDEDPITREVANYFRVLTREVQKRTNQLIDDSLDLTREQQLILRSLITP